LDEEDERNRYFIQLYHYVATGATFKGQNVLEVGSGRGGGASYIRRYLRPKTMTGVDFSERAVSFCRERHKIGGLDLVYKEEYNSFNSRKFHRFFMVADQGID